MIRDENFSFGSQIDSLTSHAVVFSQDKYQDQSSWIIYGIVPPPTIKTACLKRKAEYLAGRYCAKKAMYKHGFVDSNFQLYAGENRAPVWPDTLTGSISHSDGFAVSVVTSCSNYRGIGIDVESMIKESSLINIRNYISLDSEQSRFYKLYSGYFSETAYYSLIFSAKESIYKSINPIVGTFFGFHDAEIIEINAVKSEFTFELKVDLSPEFQSGYQGRGVYLKDESRVMSLICTV